MSSGETPAVPTNPAFDANGIALILKEIIDAEPEIIAIMANLAPISAELPPPFNLLANPLVVEAVGWLPKLLPMLKRIEAILNPQAA